MTQKLTKNEVLELVKKIYELDMTEEEVSAAVDVFEENVPYPAAGDLIFWDSRDLTPEEVVEIAWNYKEEK
ncbi:bacteriocin immunity protein [Bacillus toyonensis]|uniref:bacteriocin immunity protein n=1 Tax=Bacillus toyonensis TaxID=155322 RepID=UPI001C0C8621|nr:bacteriocin immunity protein [Bacillus toyonensis]MBU4643126.1 bacteriocin immunity protein [Bacillus toyonensis]